MMTITIILILLNVIYGGAIVWCARSMRATNPARKRKPGRVVQMKIDEMIALALDDKLDIPYNEMKTK